MFKLLNLIVFVLLQSPVSGVPGLRLMQVIRVLCLGA